MNLTNLNVENGLASLLIDGFHLSWRFELHAICKFDSFMFQTLLRIIDRLVPWLLSPFKGA